MAEERWHHCEVPYTRYEVSDQGRVRNAHTGLILKPYVFRNAYLGVMLSYKGEKQFKLIHRLVATAFVPGWRKGLQVNHKNGVKNDNRAENLEWVTQSENMHHRSNELLIDVKPVALFDEQGHLQHVYNSAQACDRAMGGDVHKHINQGYRFHSFRPYRISVPMYREIVHLVNVHRYTLQSAFIEASLNLNPPPAPPEGSGATKEGSNGSMRQRRGSNGSNVGADSLPQPLRKKGSKTVCPNNTQPAAQTGKGNQNYQLSTINYQLSDEA